MNEQNAWGVKRDIPLDSLRRWLRAGAAFYLVSGASAILASTLGVATHPSGLLILGCVVTLAGICAPLLVRLDDQAFERFYERAGVLFVCLTGIGVTVAGYLAGPYWSIITVAYVQTLIVAFFALKRRVAIVVVCLTAAEYGALLTQQPEVPGRIVLWITVVAGFAVTSALIGSIVDRAERSAASEHAARTELAGMNATLEQRVAEQVDQLSRHERLRRFLPPQVADMVLSSDDDAVLDAHRRHIAVFFCDLRGFTGFTSHVEPEDVIQALNAYHAAVGGVLREFGATVGSFSGDGIMAFLNDPIERDEPTVSAIEMSLALTEPMRDLGKRWSSQGYRLGYGIGVAAGFATIGVVGFEGRYDYTPTGSVVNLASRLSDIAADGEILIDQRTASECADRFLLEPIGTPDLKGFSEPVTVLRVTGRTG